MAFETQINTKSLSKMQCNALLPASPNMPLSLLFPLLWGYLRKENDASVGHGKGQAQDAAAHNGVAQVEDRHAE